MLSDLGSDKIVMNSVGIQKMRWFSVYLNTVKVELGRHRFVIARRYDSCNLGGCIDARDLKGTGVYPSGLHITSGLRG